MENITMLTNNKTVLDEEKIVDLTLAVFMSLMCIVCISGNIIVLITIAKTKKLQTVTSVFLANLAFADLCLGVAMMPLVAHSSVEGEWVFGTNVCQLTTYLVKVFATASNSSIALIALDRYLSIIHCLQYTSWSHKLYGCLALLIMWTEALILPVSDLSGILETPNICLERLSNSYTHSVIIAVFLFFIPVSVMIFCHSMIIKVARSHSRKIGDINSQINRQGPAVPPNGIIALAFVDPVRRLSMMGQPNVNLCSVKRNFDLDLGSYGSGSHCNVNGEGRTKRKTFAIVRLILLVIVFCVIWCPIIIIEIAYYFDNRHAVYASRNELLCKLAECLIAFHCTLNPYMYGLSSRRFRGHVSNMFHARDDTHETNQATKLVTIMNNRNINRLRNQPIRAPESDGTIDRGGKSMCRQLSLLSVPNLEKDTVNRMLNPKRLRFKDLVSVYDVHSDVPRSLSSEDEGVCVDEESQPVKIVLHRPSSM